jgi:chromosome segregation ATPase
MEDEQSRTPTKTLQSSKSTKREEYIDKLTKQLKEWDNELKKLEAQSEKRLFEWRERVNWQLDRLHTKRNELRMKINRIEDVSEEAFKDIKNDTEILWTNIKQGFNELRKEIKK